MFYKAFAVFTLNRFHFSHYHCAKSPDVRVESEGADGERVFSRRGNDPNRFREPQPLQTLVYTIFLICQGAPNSLDAPIPVYMFNV
jgi:hypothetical protein